MSGWNQASFVLGLALGAGGMLFFLLFLCWAEERAAALSQSPRERELDEKRQKLVDKLKQRQEAVRWTE